MNILAVEGLRAGYGGEDILHGVSLVVPTGKIVAIIGPNGSGKSTLLKTIYGLVRPRAGTVTLEAADITGIRPERLTAMGVNMVPQLANVFPELSVMENLQVGALPIRQRFKEQFEKVTTALPRLTGLLKQRGATLSGGQRQMVAFGRALMSDPRLLLLDEPSAGLSPIAQAEVFGFVRSMCGLGVSVLMVEQKARQCLVIADYGYVLEQGRNRLEGPAAAMLTDPEVVRLYLGAGRAAAAAALP